VIGVAWDGTGYGSDGRIWGGEFLMADYRGFRRVGHLEYLPMPGGEAAIRNPYRLAIGYLYALTGSLSAWGAEIGEEELQIIRRQIDSGLNCPYTSAGGRLFDAVSALLGVCTQVSYEGQAAVELEMQAVEGEPDAAYPFDVDSEVIRLRPFFEALLADRERGASVAEMAWRFHVTVAEMIRALCERIAAETELQTVALSGGCFQNRLLVALTVPRLEAVGLRVLLHRQVPCNDGGVSLGQAVIAHFSTE
jgi:hydrogenase maturation protein HypF